MIKFINQLIQFWPITLFVVLYAIKQILHSFERTPNTFDFYFGVPGSGKSTVGASLYHKFLKKSRKSLKKAKRFKKVPVEKRIFTTIELPLAKALLFNKNDIGKYDMSNSLMIYDEAAFDYNNRDFKTNFGPKQLEFFKLHRHYNIDIAMFSQGPEDIDLKLRQLCTRVFHVKKSPIPFVIQKKMYVKDIVLNKDNNGFENGYRSSILMNSFIFSPKYWKHFNSWDAPKLQDKQWLTVEDFVKKMNNDNETLKKV